MTDERISPDELAYHQAVLAEVQAAQGAWSSWLRHLANKYGLGPGDTITRDGVLVQTTGGSTMPTYEIDLSNRTIYFITGTLTTTASALGSSLEDLTELVIQADPDNGVNILLGDSASQGWKLTPGEWFNIPIRNPALIYGKAASGTATYSLFGRKGD